jgi:hypothetical protein
MGKPFPVVYYAIKQKQIEVEFQIYLPARLCSRNIPCSMIYNMIYFYFVITRKSSFIDKEFSLFLFVCISNFMALLDMHEQHDYFLNICRLHPICIEPTLLKYKCFSNPIIKTILRLFCHRGEKTL